jgi:CRP/FNR family transcriptional regulator, cyclic AMP receptor protein
MSTKGEDMGPPTTDLSIETALRRCELFRPLSDRQIGELAACATVRPVPAGEVLFEQGEDALDLFVVAEGRVAVRFSTPIGDGIDVFDAGQYHVCGWSSLIAPHEYVAGAKAVEDATVLVVPSAAAEDVFLLEPFAGYEVIKLLAGDVSIRLRNVRTELLRLANGRAG